MMSRRLLPQDISRFLVPRANPPPQELVLRDIYETDYTETSAASTAGLVVPVGFVVHVSSDITLKTTIELRDMAKHKNIANYRKMTRNDLISALIN